MSKTFITSIGTANPLHKIPQTQVAAFMAKALHLEPREERKLQVLYRAATIDYRYSVLEDYARTQDFVFYPNEDVPFPSTSQRMEVYEKYAVQLAIEATKDCFQNFSPAIIQEITHLITVSCTGMYAPGLDIEMVEQLGLNTSVQRTCINFMGCYAAFNALKVADAICKSDGKAKVLIIDVELCTLHLQKSQIDDHLVANALFGDGAAAVLLESVPSGAKNLSLDAFHCDLASEGKKEMAWHIQDFGFDMRLSSYVPELLEGKIEQLVAVLLEKLNLNLEEIGLFAIHPGGRRILEVVEEKLGVSREKNKAAYEVLKEYGNMSSVTIFFVLQNILSKISEADHQRNILSMAFGPGLTLESALMQVHASV